MSQTKDNSFFEKYAHEYDFLTNAVQRRNNHRKEIDALINKFQPTAVIDAGCASGLTSSLFAETGIKTKGIDRSRPMIKKAKENYGTLDNLSFHIASFESLPKSYDNKFDLVVCLANSISGVGSLRNLSLAFKGFYKTLKPGGVLVLQMLNYASIPNGVLQPIRATQNNKIYYQRFTERRGQRLYIYVNRLDTSKNPLQYEMFRHEFDNFKPTEVISTLKKTKFTKINKYADLFLKKKFDKSSRDLILTAVKS